MTTEVRDPHLRAIFQPDGTSSPRALLVAGACGNVGFGKLGQFARVLRPFGIPVIALDLSPAVLEIPNRLREAFGKKFDAAAIDDVLAGVHLVQGTLKDVPAELAIGFVFEALPERLGLKRDFYAALRARDAEAFVFSATSGLTTKKLFDGLDGKERCGVLHPFFPHLTNKLWELPERGAVTSRESLKTVKGMFATLGMSLISVADVPAFAADRIFCGMMLEAVRIHADTGLGPAEIDDVCRKVLGTQPFLVHNLIPGANYLSAHCMELMQEEVDSTLYAIPDLWRPYTEDAKKQWPYEKGKSCPPERFEEVKGRMLGMLYTLTAYMLQHGIAKADELNFLCENALAFRMGTPALVQADGFAAASATVRAFVEGQKISKGDDVAPLTVFQAGEAATNAGFGSVYTSTAVHGEIGLLSLKRSTLNHAFVAELDAAYERLNGDPSVKAIVIAPDGKLSREFGHGADIACFVPVLGNYDAALKLIQTWKKTLSKLRTGKPTVAALVGRVLGGGLEFASNCHARIAAAGTRLGQPEPTVGVVPGLGGCHLIHRQSETSAHGRISELLLTGHSWKAEEAAGWGFISEIVPVAELPKRSFELAAKIAGGEIPTPFFRRDGLSVPMRLDVTPTNEAGVPHDAELRQLIADTVVAANATTYEEGAKLEEQAAARSLTMSCSKIGVTAMQRGKPPAFEKTVS